MKRLASAFSLFLTAMMVFTSCGTKAPETGSTTQAPPSQDSTVSSTQQATSGEKQKVKFYGLINEYTPVAGMIERMKEKLPQYDIEVIPVDWGNLDQVIKTGIASGEPCDVYCYWPQAMDQFIKVGQAYDLTEALDADGGKWRNTFVPAQLQTGEFDGKVYAVPLDATYQMALVNKKIFDEAGVTINPTWTFDEFMQACEKIKAIDKQPFALWRDGQEWFVKNTVASALKSEGRYDEWINNKLPGSDPILSKSLDLAKTIDEKGYWYPGQGGVNSARDEARASFTKGDTAVLFEMASLFVDIKKEVDFEVVPVCWPKTGTETVNIGGTDGFFIPSNAKNKEGAIECLKVLLDDESQAKLPEAGIIPSNKSVQINDGDVKILSELSQYMEAKTLTNPELTTFIKQVFLADYVLGARSKDEILKEYDTILKEIN